MNNSVYRKRRTAARRGAVLKCCLLFCFIAGMRYANAQDTAVPSGIAEQFYMQYPYATDLKYAAEGNQIIVDFLMKNEKYEAFYKKNEWTYTVMDFSYDRLPDKIKEGFKRSRLGEAVVADVAVVYIPSGFETYRFQLKDTGTTKKYHYFSESGKMLHAPPYQD
ncbi:hypothetical protein [Niabella aurantiaca]|uniref:hypothetical protein n=1 Tax=Niabella aurantiaca TaxID=379900 RepID=UPI0003759052|nr:hypothetical protein [Niabella aurantiaca]